MEELIKLHFESQVEQYDSKMIQKEKIQVIINPFIKDQYWNMGYLVTDDNISIKDIWESIEEIMKKEQRDPLLYITTNYEIENLEEQLQELNLKQKYCDRWLAIEELDNFQQAKANIPISINKVNHSLQKEFVDTVFRIFSGENSDDPYEALSIGYREAYEESFKEKQTSNQTVSYLATYKEEAIGTATIMYDKKHAIIYSLGTVANYQKLGVCKEMIGKIIEDVKKMGIQIVALQTEKGFYTEEVYKKLGFKYVLDGIAYQEEM